MKIKLRLFVVIAFVITTKLSFAQWSQVGYMIYNGTDTVPDCHGFKGFGNKVYSTTDSGLYASTDNGDSWQNITSASAVTMHQKIYSVHVAANGDIYTGSNKRLFKSTDNGANWTWLSSLPDNTMFYDITEIGTNIIASFNNGSSNGVYCSNDGGDSWHAATGINSSVRFFLIDGATVYAGGTANGVYTSSDNGQSWTVLGSGIPASSGIWSVKKLGNGYFANSVTGVGLYASYDNGSTWSNANTSVFNGFCQVFSTAAADNMIIASMDGACNVNEPIKVSTDTGLTWSSFMTGLPSAGYYPNVGRNFNGTSFFVKKGGPLGYNVYRYDILPTGVSINNNPTTNLSLFPNPTSGKFNINYHTKNKNCFIEIFNSIGEKIVQLPFENPQHSYEIDLSNYTKGFYFVKLTDGGSIYSNKIVVE